MTRVRSCLDPNATRLCSVGSGFGRDMINSEFVFCTYILRIVKSCYSSLRFPFFHLFSNHQLTAPESRVLFIHHEIPSHIITRYLQLAICGPWYERWHCITSSLGSVLSCSLLDNRNCRRTAFGHDLPATTQCSKYPPQQWMTMRIRYDEPTILTIAELRLALAIIGPGINGRNICRATYLCHFWPR